MSPTKIPKFLQSLYNILHDEDSAILAWSADGSYFQVLNVTRLEREVLPKYFKHGKFTSFQRQLNNFSFRKWTKTRANVCTFSHDVLAKCHPSQLSALVAKYMTLKSANATPITTRMDPVVALKRQRSETCVSSCVVEVKKLKAFEPPAAPDVADNLVNASGLSVNCAWSLDVLDVADLWALDWSPVAVCGDLDAAMQEPLSIELEGGDCDIVTPAHQDWDLVVDCMEAFGPSEDRKLMVLDIDVDLDILDLAF